MDMGGGNCAPDNFHLLVRTNLSSQITDSGADIANQYRVTIFRYPDDMVGTIEGGVAGFAIVLHILQPTIRCREFQVKTIGRRPRVLFSNLGQ